MVGKFKIDLGTIYSQTDHNFYHKWAVLIDPADLNTGPKGYLKVTLLHEMTCDPKHVAVLFFF